MVMGIEIAGLLLSQTGKHSNHQQLCTIFSPDHSSLTPFLSLALEKDPFSKFQKFSKSI